MNKNQIEIRELLNSLKNDYSDELEPASSETVENFKINAQQKGVNKEVIEQLADLYLTRLEFITQTKKTLKKQLSITQKQLNSTL